MATTDSAQGALIGKTLGGYQVQALIGQGAMGYVYLALDPSLNRPAALKVLLGELSGDQRLVRMFHQEAKAAAPLRHANIVRIYTAGVEGGAPYIAMEYVEGEPLDRFIKRQGEVNWQTALYIGQQVADALVCAHAHGVTHRDIKPANILLDKHGRVRLTDFGIANVISGEGEPPDESQILGTPHYMSPEQCSGGKVGPATDLYSLGVMLYYLITGRLPFDNPAPMALVRSITNDDAPRVNKIKPDVPDDVARLVAHLMARQPEDRPPNARHVVGVIVKLQRERGGHSAMPEALRRFMKEQTQIRQIRSLLKDHDFASETPGKKRRKAPLPVRALAVRLGAVIGIIGFCVVVAAIASWAAHRDVSPSEAIELQDASFQALNVRTLVAELPFPAFECASLSWLDGEPVVLCLLKGRPGSRQHGAAGLAAIDVTARTVRNIVTPAGPATTPEFYDLRLPLAACPSSLDAPRGNTGQSAVLLSKLRPGNEPAVDLVLQPWTETAGRTLARVTLEQWTGPYGPSGVLAPQGNAVIRPDGKAICLALYDVKARDFMLYERSLDPENPDETDVQLTKPGKPLLPETMTYAGDGAAIGYYRRAYGELPELCVAVTGRDGARETNIAWGVVNPAPAFSPDGSLMALRQSRMAQEPEIRLVSSANGMTQAFLGPGHLGLNPWHSSGTFLAVVEDRKLLAVGVQPPHERIELLQESRTCLPGASFAKDGAWLAVPCENANGVAILFMRLDRVEFDDLVSREPDAPQNGD